MSATSRSINELNPPPAAKENSEAFEVLRLWAIPGKAHQVTIQTAWKDPGAWGLALVDIARHVAKAYAHEGKNESETLDRIRALFNAEWKTPTDDPLELDESN